MRAEEVQKHLGFVGLSILDTTARDSSLGPSSRAQELAKNTQGMLRSMQVDFLQTALKSMWLPYATKPLRYLMIFAE